MTIEEIQQEAEKWGLRISQETAEFTRNHTSPISGGTIKGLLDNLLTRAFLKNRDIDPTFVEEVIQGLEAHRDYVPPHKLERAGRIFEAIEFDDVESVQELLEEGIVDLESFSSKHDGMTPLILACEKANSKLVEMLLAAGAKPESSGRHGASPIHLAMRDLECLNLLLAAGADPNSQAEDEITPVMCFETDADLEQVRRVLEAGADPAHVDKTGMTASLLAEKRGTPRIAEELRRRL